MKDIWIIYLQVLQVNMKKMIIFKWKLETFLDLW